MEYVHSGACERESPEENVSGREGLQSPPPAGEGAIRVAESRDILRFATVDNPHESAGLTGSGSPVHVAAPRSSAAPAALTPVSKLDGGEARDISGGGAPSL